MKIRSLPDHVFLEPYERLEYQSQQLRERMLALPEGDPERARLGRVRIAIAQRKGEFIRRNVKAFIDAMHRQIEREKPASA
jgi:hypothetical protein